MIVQWRGRSHGKGNPRVGYEAGRRCKPSTDARTQTEAAPDGQTDMRYPTRESELANRRLRLRLPLCTILPYTISVRVRGTALSVTTVVLDKGHQSLRRAEETGIRDAPY